MTKEKTFADRFSFKKLALFLFISYLPGIFGSAFTAPAISSWYVFLRKPSFTPPNWIFGPAWTLLYFLMGLSAYLVFQKGYPKPQVRTTLLLYFFHLILNGLWSLAFFGLRSPFFGLVVITLLWLVIVVLLIRFFRILKVSAFLFLPYLFWVSFAWVLNYSVFLLN